jgi:predicted Zn-dependent peptidase
MVLQNLAGIEDEPAHRTLAALRRLQSPAPWGMPTEGISAEVESIEIDDVREFVAQNLQPAGMIVSVAGRIEWDDFVRRVEALLGDWQAAPAPPVAKGPRGAATLHVTHDAQQTHVAVGWPAPPYRDDTSHEATAALAVLGGGPSSRFFTEIRERRALCYTVSAGYQTSRDFAHAVCYSGTSADRAQETLDVMLAEIARLPGTITRDEVDRVKARAKSGLIMQQEAVVSPRHPADACGGSGAVRPARRGRDRGLAGGQPAPRSDRRVARPRAAGGAPCPSCMNGSPTAST